MLIEFASFLRFPVKGQKRFEYSTYGFENEKKISFQKYPGSCGRGLLFNLVVLFFQQN